MAATPHNVVWFDIPATDLDRAMVFYGQVLKVDLDRQDFPGYSMAILPHTDETPGGCLFLSAEPVSPCPNGPLMYFNVSGRLEEAAGLVEQLGGKILIPPHPIGPYGHRAVVQDSEGNRIALHSP